MTETVKKENYNRVQLCGRISFKKVTEFSDGGKVCTFSLGQKVRGKGDTFRPVFHKLEVWGDLLKRHDADLQDGRTVFVEGKLLYSEWQDKKTGEKRKAAVVRCQSLDFSVTQETGEMPQHQPEPIPFNDDLPF
jgi:single-stranded DNA-binding protein